MPVQGISTTNSNPNELTFLAAFLPKIIKIGLCSSHL